MFLETMFFFSQVLLDPVTRLRRSHSAELAGSHGPGAGSVLFSARLGLAGSSAGLQVQADLGSAHTAPGSCQVNFAIIF